jgi:phosphopantetheine adenylyltransferase
MFGFGFKSKVKTIVEEDLESFVTPMFAGRFSNIVREGKAHNANEYSVAIEFVLQITEHLESVWSEETGKVEKVEIIEDIQGRCENIKSIMHEANVSQDEILNRIDNLLGKIQ